MANVAGLEVSRRERLRRQTIEEIKARAFELVDAGGVNAVTVAAVGKAMGMTPPALYRYFRSREAVIEALIVEAYVDLGSTIESAALTAADQNAAHRFRLLARVYLQWARAHPRRYAMMFSDRPLSARPDPSEGLAALSRGMLAFLATLDEIASAKPPRVDTPLDDALLRYGAAIGAPSDTSALALQLGVLTLTRLHGLVTLHISGGLDIMGMNVETLTDLEIASIVNVAAGLAVPPHVARTS